MEHSKNALIIPVRIGGAKMPAAKDLPDDIKQLVSIHAISIEYHQFSTGVAALLDPILTHFEKMGIELAPPPGVRIVDEFPLSKVQKMIAKAKNLQVMHTWTSYIGLCQWAIVNMLSNGGSFKILLVDPFCPAAEQRGKDSKENVREEVMHTLRKINQIRLDPTIKNPASIKVRLYKKLPYTPIYIVDNVVVMGYYPYNQRSHITPHLIIQGLEAEISEYAITQFSALWESVGQDLDMDNLDDYLANNYR